MNYLVLLLSVVAINARPEKSLWRPAGHYDTGKYKSMYYTPNPFLPDEPVGHRMSFIPRNDIEEEDDCGEMNLTSSRIVGGMDAGPHQFPWQAALFITKHDGHYFCGGSLITKRHVMTAAHCAEGASEFKVILGSNNREGFDEGAVEIVSRDATVHPDWGIANGNDIAIITLPEDVPSSESTRTSCMPTDLVGNDLAGEKVWVSGWGRTSDTGSELPSNLQYVDNLTVMTYRECHNVYGDFVTKDILCTDSTGPHGTCSGDSGGPLIYHQSGDPANRFVQVGIVSFGSAAGCEVGAPNGFTRLTSFLTFISQVTGLSVKL